MKLFFNASVWAGKTTTIVLKIAGSGGAALPGLVSQKLDSSILTRLSKQCSEGTILIAGTNGKTTTSRLLASILAERGKKLVHNRSGSNLTRGHIAAFLEQTSWSGKLRADVAILEVDEAVLPTTLQQTQPSIVLLHNLFRDQLDRYGEVDAIAKKWLTALKQHLPSTATLLINADDPNLAYLAEQLHHPHTIFYGLNDPAVSSPTATATVDAYLSPASGAPLSYSAYYLSHLGDYTDPQSTFSRPNLTIQAKNIHLNATSFTSSFQLTTPEDSLPLTTQLPGLYNVYNGLAAASCALTLRIPLPTIAKGLESTPSAFGRFERIQFGQQEIVLCLIKNPTGASEVLRTIALDPEPLNLTILANDQFADGQDVSWYWDTPFELIAPKISHLACGGIRGLDMAVRLKYADVQPEITILPNLAQSYPYFKQQKGKRLYCLATYTATLELQKVFTQHKIKASYWKE